MRPPEVGEPLVHQPHCPHESGVAAVGVIRMMISGGYVTELEDEEP